MIYFNLYKHESFACGALPADTLCPLQPPLGDSFLSNNLVAMEMLVANIRIMHQLDNEQITT